MTATRKISLGSFDFAKGFLMILVILGHTVNSGNYNILCEKLFTNAPYLLNSAFFIIPAFFIISGFGFKDKPAGKLIKKLFRDLIIPYLLVMLAIALVYPFSYYFQFHNWSESITITIRFLLAFALGIPEYGKVFLGYDVLSIYALWFFLTLFVAMNGLNLIIKIKNRAVQVCIVAVCALVGYSLLIREINYFCIPQGLIAIGYCYVGYLLKRFDLIEMKRNYTLVYVVLGAISLAEIKWGYFDLCLGNFKNGFLDCIAAGCGGVLFTSVSLRIGRFEWKGLDWIKQIGVYSYWILCIHTVEARLAQWNILAASMSSQGVAFILELAIKAGIIISVCHILKKISKYKYRRRVNRREKQRILT